MQIKRTRAKKAVTKDKCIRFRVTEYERLQIHNLLMSKRTTLIDLIYNAYGAEIKNLVIDKDVKFQVRKR